MALTACEGRGEIVSISLLGNFMVQGGSVNLLHGLAELAVQLHLLDDMNSLSHLIGNVH